MPERDGSMAGLLPEYSCLHHSNMKPPVGNRKIVSRQIIQGSFEEAINKAKESQRSQIDRKTCLNIC